MTDLNTMTKEQLIAMVAAMQTAPRKLTLKITEPKLDEKTGEMKGSTGAISLYGLGRFPVTLYANGWERLLAEASAITAFIKANEAKLARKD